MKFKAKEDLEAPIEKVFDMLVDFERHERSALRRGIEISRDDASKKQGVGATWTASFKYRGKPRKARIEITEFERPNQITLAVKMQGMDAQVEFMLVALSKTRTRLSLMADLKPQTLSARLLLQSFKLARGSIMKRFEQRLATVARDMEDRAAKMA
ncbi:SRPBCC family protein [Shimia sp. FJ5]|uniref:SRPBCC family protein n=1 Tax=Shimia sp. FJ5 TaxID=3079054 RepID=UPI0026163D46|nr:SRPBCC family protein [Shimia sp. FJ5]MDV4143404.1 SRPBCC family protein [Shimia sp. FJ5]